MFTGRAKKYVIHRIDYVLKVGNFAILKIALICEKFNLTSHHKIFIN